MGSGAWLELDELENLLEAFQWCSGSSDFGAGGQAEIGWNKMVRPLMILLIDKIALVSPIE